MRPLTILVGENSSGKSTFLALTRLAYTVATSFDPPDFNEDPFQLGAYDQIAHYHGGQGKRAASFVIGGSFRVPAEGKEPTLFEFEGTFVQSGAQPALSRWTGHSQTDLIEIAFDGTEGTLHAKNPEGTVDEKFERTRVPVPIPFGDLYLGLTTPRGRELPKKAKVRVMDLLGRFHNAVTSQPRPSVSAPIRSKPIRTYDPRRDVPDPEGQHVPMVLADLKSSDSEQWGSLRKGLEAIGIPAGLMESVDIKRKGNKPSDPFQIHVGIGGFEFNLVDVGYGVSQVLPLLVDCLLASPGTTFLFQQPEVHLHPRAQAELGSFFAHQAKAHGLRFVIETHSDYLIDRVRMDIRDKKAALAPDDVVILFFHRDGTRAKIDPIWLDERAELRDAPGAYRDFFLQEQRRFLGT